MSAPQIRLQPGSLCILDGTHYKVLSRDSAGVTLRTLALPPVTITKAHGELADLYFSTPRRFRLVVEAALGLPEPQRRNLEHALESFSAAQQNEALRRFEFVQRFEQLHRARQFKKTPGGFAKAAAQIAHERRARQADEDGVALEQVALDPVGGSTLKRWVTFWIKSGGSLAALVPAHDKKGRAGFRLDPEVEEIIGRLVRRDWLTLEAPPVSHLIEWVGAAVEEMNKTRSVPLPIPDAMTIRRWVQANVALYDQVFYRKGPKAAEALFKEVRPGPTAARPLEVVEIDHTPMDVLVMERDGTPARERRRKDKRTKRVWLTLAICAATRMIVGFYIGTEAPSWTSVMNALRMMVLPKDVEHLKLRTSWPVFGVPEILRLDNGREFHSRSMLAAAGQLKFELQYLPRGKPHMKGKVERAIGTIARDFLAYLPGRTFRDPRERGDYDSVGRAALTLEELIDAFTLWVVDIYHNRPHGGLLRQTPLSRWNDLAGFGVRVPPSADDLDALIALVVPRQIRRTGITFLGLTYQSTELRDIRRRAGFNFGDEFLVKVDPADIGTLLVLDEHGAGRWIAVPCVDARLASGVSLVEWRVTMETARRMTTEGQRVARTTLRKAMTLLREQARAAGAKPIRPRPIDIAWFRDNADNPFFDVAPEPTEDQGKEARRVKARLPARSRARKGPELAATRAAVTAAVLPQHAPQSQVDNDDPDDLATWTVE